MKIINEEHYHICLYPQFELELNKEYSTDNILRDHGLIKSQEKKEAEKNMENIRIENYPDLPSRKKCFYVCTQDMVEIWLKVLLRNNPNGYKIFKVSLTGEIFWADSYQFDDNLPNEYWQGCECFNNDGRVEGLFLGEYQAIEDCTKQFKKP